MPPTTESDELTPETPDTATGFATLGLPGPLLAAVAALGFAEPTAIQAAAIPTLLAGRDVTGIAQTGTGKTAAFGLPLLAAIDPADPAVQALVLTPTRELALQVAGALSDLAATLPGVDVTAVYGGAPMGGQLAALRRGVQVVVGTPGRIIDHLDRGSLHLDRVRFAVLDEADEMLQMGFAEDTDRILAAAPADRQTALFSATMPDGIRAVARRHLRRPVDVSVAESATPVVAIRQRYAVLPYRAKVDALARILATTDAEAAVVFVRTRSACDEVGAQLAARGIPAAVISGDVSQPERERIIARLRSRQVDVLVATDVAARGLDVERIGLVVNFDAPSDPDAYVHRVGRTGRAGRAGEALLFVTPREIGRLRAIERATGQRLEQMTPPTAAQVTAHRAAARLREALARHPAGRLGPCRTAVEAAAEQSGLSVTEIAAALLAVAAGDDGADPQPEPAAEAPGRARWSDRADRDSDRPRLHAVHDEGDRRAAPDRRDRRDDHSDRTDRAVPDARDGRRRPARANDAFGDRYVVAVGRRDGVRPAGIVGAITGEGGLSGADIGRIDIFDDHSVVEITRPMGSAALARIRRATVSGRQLRIREDRPPVASHARNGRHGASQNRAGWTAGAAGRSRGGRAPLGKRDSALPGTPRAS